MNPLLLTRQALVQQIREIVAEEVASAGGQGEEFTGLDSQVELLTDLKGLCLVLSCFKHKKPISNHIIHILSAISSIVTQMSGKREIIRQFSRDK